MRSPAPDRASWTLGCDQCGLHPVQPAAALCV
jgi:hypothetical protein